MTGGRRFPYDELVDLVARLFRAVNVPVEDAEVTANRLVEADLRGRTGHGLIRVVPYLDRIRAGGLNPRPAMRVLHETAVSAQIDADNGLGTVAMTRAAELAIGKARESGVAMIGTVRSNHAGAAGLYPAMAAAQGLVGIYCAVANANGLPPWGGTAPILGTNPLAIAVPTADGRPFLLDIATTTASHGAIKVVRQEGRQLPVGWIVDGAGAPITDPARADDGYLVPIGGHKGAGLTLALGLLAGVLNGAAFGRDVVDARSDLVTPTNTGQLLVVFRADLFRPLETVLRDVAASLSDIRCSGSVDGEALRLPGDRAAALEEENRRLGLEVPPPILAALDDARAELGVA